MRHFLLTLATAGMCASMAVAADYGTTPETAVPLPAGGWFLENLDNAPEAAYFTLTNEGDAPVNWGDAPTAEGRQIYVYLCDGGQEAFQRAEGSDSYILLPGRKYLVKITPKAAGFFGLMPGMPLPALWEGKYKYYPKVIEMGRTFEVKKGETTWIQFESAYPTQLNITSFSAMNPWGPILGIVDQIEAIHIECPGGTNVGDALIQPYIKAGQNVVGITASEDMTEESAQLMLTLNGMVTLNCANHLDRSLSMQLDAEETYPDAYYTVDRYFTVPEDGTYTFFNHGAKGSLLNVGMMVVPGSDDKSFECDWSDIKTAVVGDNDAVIVVKDLKKDDNVLVQSDAFGIIGKGMEDQPYLKVVKGDAAGINGVAAETDGLKASVSDGVLNVTSPLLASGAEVNVYDMKASKVASYQVAKGVSSVAVNLDVNAGVYIVVVKTAGISDAVKVIVK